MNSDQSADANQPLKHVGAIEISVEAKNRLIAAGLRPGRPVTLQQRVGIPIDTKDGGILLVFFLQEEAIEEVPQTEVKEVKNRFDTIFDGLKAFAASEPLLKERDYDTDEHIEKALLFGALQLIDFGINPEATLIDQTGKHGYPVGVQDNQVLILVPELNNVKLYTKERLREVFPHGKIFLPENNDDTTDQTDTPSHPGRS